MENDRKEFEELMEYPEQKEADRKISLLKSFIYDKIRDQKEKIDDKNKEIYQLITEGEDKKVKDRKSGLARLEAELHDLQGIDSMIADASRFANSGCVIGESVMFDNNGSKISDPRVAEFQRAFDRLGAHLDEKARESLCRAINHNGIGNSEWERRQALTADKESVIKTLEGAIGKYDAHNHSIQGLKKGEKVDFSSMSYDERKAHMSSPVQVIDSIYSDLQQLSMHLNHSVRFSEKLETPKLSEESAKIVNTLKERVQLGRQVEGQDKKLDAQTKKLAGKVTEIESALFEIDRAKAMMIELRTVSRILQERQAKANQQVRVGDKSPLATHAKKQIVDFSKAVAMMESMSQQCAKTLKDVDKKLEEYSKLANSVGFDIAHIKVEYNVSDQEKVASDVVKEELTQQDIGPYSMEAKQFYDMWMQSGTGREFLDWCIEERGMKHEDLMKLEGWQEYAKQVELGQRQYREQQRAYAEATKDEIAPEAYSIYERYSQSGSPLEFASWCDKNGIAIPKGWGKIQEDRFKGMKEYQEQQAKEAESLVGTVDPMAYGIYDAYSKSGSPLEFPQWCDKNGHAIPRGWEKLQEERFRGMKEYQEQQAKVAEALNETIDPMAYGYYDTYSNSGSPLDFVSWCDQKGVQPPMGWQKVEAERLAGMKAYQEQQSEMDDDSMNM